MEHGNAPAAALAALEEVIPPHLRANRHGANFMGERYEIIRAALATRAPSAPADQPSPDKQGQQGVDTARMDWLEEYFTDVHGVYVDADKTVKAFFVDCEDDTMGSNKDRIRSAIDAARLAASPAPTEEPIAPGERQ